MNEIQIFNSPEFGEIRTVIIDNEPWFAGKDVCKSLGYAKPTQAIHNNVDKEDTLRKGLLDSRGIEQETIVINESGLYALIFGSKLDSAKKFKKWVTSEVLPSIRKTGTYGQPQLPENPMEMLKIHYAALEQVDKKVDKVESRIDELNKKLQDELMNLPLLGVESETIDNALKRRGVEIAGGKESNAYKDKNLLRRIYWDLHGQLRREFGVSTYKAIKRNQTDIALKFLAEYKPPLFLAEQIANVNAQQTLGLKGGAAE